MTSVEYHTGVDHALSRFAERLGAQPLRLMAPLYADAETVTAMRRDSILSQSLGAANEADVMVFGVGSVSTSTTLFEGAYLDAAILDELAGLDAVGEIGGRFYDVHGTAGRVLTRRPHGVGPPGRRSRLPHNHSRLRWSAPPRVDSGRRAGRIGHHPGDRPDLRALAHLATERSTMTGSPEPDAASAGSAPPRRRRWRRLLAPVALASAVTLAATACAGAGSFTDGGSEAVTIALVSNSQMQDAIALSRPVREGEPGDQAQVRHPLRERGPRKDHRLGRHRRRRVRRRDDQQLRDRDLGRERVAGQPEPVHGVQPGVRPEDFIPTLARRCRTRATCTRHRSTASRRS